MLVLVLSVTCDSTDSSLGLEFSGCLGVCGDSEYVVGALRSKRESVIPTVWFELNYVVV